MTKFMYDKEIFRHKLEFELEITWYMNCAKRVPLFSIDN